MKVGDSGNYTNVIRLSFTTYPSKGESEGYTVKSKEEDFTISDYPLLQTEFLYDSKTGTAD